MRKIRKRCKCGCGEITNYGKMYIWGHSQRGKKKTVETRRKMSEARYGRKHSAETKRKISEAAQNMSDATRLKMSLASMKDDPNYQYCEVWKDKEYVKDIRKDYCENVDCSKDYKRLGNHHICLDKKRCAPNDIMTMCNSCHAILHRKLERGKNKPANPKDYLIINRIDHVSYIHKKLRMIIKIRRKK